MRNQSNNTNKTYYIALGDSFAHGVHNPSNKSSRSYAYTDALYERLKENIPNLEFKRLAKGGLGTRHIITGQLKKATDFMKSHSGLTKLITITTGRNDFVGCSPKHPNVSECLQTKLEKITYNLNNTIIPMLKEAGGESVQYAATTYFNAFPYFNLLDDRLIDVYTGNGFKVADLRHIITNESVCNYSYWCKGHHGHPNKLGSRAIADVIFKLDWVRKMISLREGGVIMFE
ncbi:28994_t:CDS:2, partial [Gigaspora margarita]